jgi:PAS domain S-box-containing protein
MVDAPRSSLHSEALDFIADAANIVVWEWDPHADLVHLDAATARSSGLPTRAATSEFLQKAIWSEDGAVLRRALESALTSTEAHTSVRVLADGRAARRFDLRLKACRNSANRAVQVVIVATDASREQPEARATDADRAVAERLSIATQAAGIYVWEYDYATETIRWDESRLTRPASNRHFGQELGSDLFKWVHPEDRNIGRIALTEALQRGELDAAFRYRLQLPDGSVRHIQAYARTYADSAGIPVRSIGVSWDVTREVEDAQQMARQTDELRTAQRRLERASASIQEGQSEIDWTTRTHWASSNYYALLGYGPNEVEFDTFEKLFSIIHPDDLAHVQEVTNEHIRQKTPGYDVETRLALKDGGYRWFRLRGVAERNEQGRLIRTKGSIHDIDKQKAAEDALEEARGRFDRAVRGTQDGLWEADIVKGIMWLSPRAHELLGYERGGLPDHLNVLRERIHPDELAACDESLQQGMARGLPLDREMRLRHTDGGYRWFRVRGTPTFASDGSVRRVSGSIQDVTDAHAARNALIDASKTAEAANRAKSAFLANMSHEIRTPMNGIIGMTSLLLDTNLDRPQREYADTIRSSADSLLTIINDILDFSKIEAGKLEIASMTMDLHECVEDIGATLAFQAAVKNIELIIDIQRGVPTSVLGDPQRIRQCLVNLIGNAVKFTQTGEIAVTVSLVRDDAKTSHIRFAVRDTGIGMSSESIRSLFQPFVQADESTTRKFGGTGLGLSIVRRLVELMGGEIGVESEPGRGSTFWFRLPMQTAAPQSAAGLATRPDGRRVLIVDDNETNRHVLAAHLANDGYDVSLASSGREALVTMRLALTRQRPFDLVLLDFQMPDMDGAMLGETINADAQLARSRVVLLTSIDRRGDIERFARLGFAGYLTKPVRLRELRACLLRIMARDAHEWHARSYPIVTEKSTPNGTAPKPFSGSVLLVEDNAVNQKVGRKFLERLGCQVSTAENGLDAMKIWQEKKFDLVLMDIQMPGMDGYTATRQLRDLEGGAARTPIVALTADAMSGQLERCLQSGMDDLLTKPLDPERLQEMLERFGLAVADDALQTTAVDNLLAASAQSGLVDVRALRELVGGDEKFGDSLFAEFSRMSADILRRMREVAASRDGSELSELAHELKGVSANLCAPGLRSSCERLEHDASDMTRAQRSQQVTELANVLERVTAVLERNLCVGRGRSEHQRDQVSR